MLIVALSIVMLSMSWMFNPGATATAGPPSWYVVVGITAWITGASFTAVTLVPSATVAAVKAVVPPLVETFTVPPLVRPVPLESASRTVRVPGVPLKFVAGRNRIEVAAFR